MSAGHGSVDGDARGGVEMGAQEPGHAGGGASALGTVASLSTAERRIDAAAVLDRQSEGIPSSVSAHPSARRRRLVYAAKRIAFIPVGLWIVATVSFFIVNLLPSDPAREKLGQLASAQEVAAETRALGLDASVLVRYWWFLDGIVHGTLGSSYYTGQSVTSMIASYLPSTLVLVGAALAIILTVGPLLGIAGARFRNRLPDRAVRAANALGQSVPDFFLGVIFIYVFFFRLRWFPAPTGQIGLLTTPPPDRTGAALIDAALAGRWSTFFDALDHLVLPAVALATYFTAVVSKVTRSFVGSQLASSQVEYARSLGLPERQVLGYAVRAARTPVLTYAGLISAGMIGNAAVIELVFSWNGFGQRAIQGTLQIDLPVIQGYVLVTGAFMLVVFVVVDVIVAWLDPRISYG